MFNRLYNRFKKEARTSRQGKSDSIWNHWAYANFLEHQFLLNNGYVMSLYDNIC